MLDPGSAETVRERMTPGDAEVEGPLPFTSDAKRALELALRTALADGAPLIEPRHLLAVLGGSAVIPPASDPVFRVVLLDGDADDWARELSEVAGLGYELVQIVDRHAIFRR